MPEHLEHDLATASFLVVRGFRLLGLQPNGQGRYLFRFEDGNGTAGQAVLDYLAGAQVPAKAITDAEKSLKTLLYSQPRERHGNGRRQVRR